MPRQFLFLFLGPLGMNPGDLIFSVWQSLDGLDNHTGLSWDGFHTNGSDPGSDPTL